MKDLCCDVHLIMRRRSVVVKATCSFFTYS